MEMSHNIKCQTGSTRHKSVKQGLQDTKVSNREGRVNEFSQPQVERTHIEKLTATFNLMTKYSSIQNDKINSSQGIFTTFSAHQVE